MGTFFWGVIGILVLVGIGRAIYDWFRKQPEPDWGNIYGNQPWAPQKHQSITSRGEKPYISPFEEEHHETEDGDQIIRFECPHPVNADIEFIQEFLDHELFLPKVEHYLELAQEMNAPAEVIEAIEERIQWLNSY